MANGLKLNFLAKLKLSQQLGVLFVILSLLPCIGLMSFMNRQTSSTMQETVGMYSEKLLDEITYKVEHAIRSSNLSALRMAMHRDFTRFLSVDSLDDDMDRYRTRRALEDLITTSLLSDPYLDGILVFKNGSVFYDSMFSSTQVRDVLKNHLLDTDFSNSPLHEALIGSTQFKWFSVFNESRGTYNLFLGQNISSGSDELFVFFGLRPLFFDELIATSSLSSDIPLMLVDDFGTIVLSNVPSKIGSSLPDYTLSILEKYNDSELKSYTTMSPYDTLLSTSLCINNWRIIVDAPLSILLKGIRDAQTYIYILLAIIILVIILISLIISSKISRSLHLIIKYMKQVEEGNLNLEATIYKELVPTNYETYALSTGFLNMLSTLRTLIADTQTVTTIVKDTTHTLHQVASHTSSSSRHIHKAIDELASGTEGQTNQLEKSTYQMDTLSASIDDVYLMLDDVKSASLDTIELSSHTSSKLSHLVQLSDQNQHMTQKLAQHVAQLGDEATNINHIINLITAINDQTNLLSLNASIEAARAGVAGRGFAVVANEIRHLSTQTQDAIRVIEDTVERIQARKHIALLDTQNAHERFKAQLPIVEETHQAFLAIQNRMHSVDDHIGSVSIHLSTIKEQKEAILTNLEEISSIIQTAASISEEVNAESCEQAHHAEQLNQLSDDLVIIIRELEQTYSTFNL